MTPATQRWLIAALAVSITINLFVAGFVAAMAIRGPWAFFGHGPHMERLVQPLSPDGRKLVHESFEHNHDAIRQQMEQLRRIRDKISAALEAEPYDAARLTAAFAEMRKQINDLQMSMQGSLVEVAGQLSPQDRKALAGLPMMQRLMMEDRPRHDKDGEHGPPPPPDAQ